MQPMGGGGGGPLPMMQPMGMPGVPMFPPQPPAHGQMVFNSNQRPQPMKMGGQTRMYNIMPMISFKVCNLTCKSQSIEYDGKTAASVFCLVVDIC